MLQKLFSIFVVLSVLVSMQLSSVANSYHYIGAYEIALHDAFLFFENDSSGDNSGVEYDYFTLEYEVEAYNDQYDEESKISQFAIFTDFSIPTIKLTSVQVKNKPFISKPDELHPPVPSPA